jgi:hypothetical protein
LNCEAIAFDAPGAHGVVMSDATKTRSPLRAVALGAFAIGAIGAIVAAASSSVRRVEEPAYESKLQDGDFELRRYGARVVAQTVVQGAWSEAGNEGFRRLAGYIFGKNRGRAKIAMTAPVAQRAEDGKGTKLPMTAPVAQRRAGDGWTVSFMMPAGESLATLPEPDDARVVLRELPPVEVAVVRFSGRWTDANMKERGDALRAWAAARGLSVLGEPEVNRYDPPFKPSFLRRNEVWLEVAAPARS